MIKVKVRSPLKFTNMDQRDVFLSKSGCAGIEIDVPVSVPFLRSAPQYFGLT